MASLSPVSYLVLGLIDRAGKTTPYDLKQMAESISGLWTLRHDQVYREPDQLAKLGLLSEDREETGRRRRLFGITDEGRQALEAWLATPSTEFTELRDVGLLQLFLGAAPEPLAERQLEIHSKRLAEYEGLAEALPHESPKAILLALEAGIGHEREWVRFWKGLLQNSEVEETEGNH